jgi:hypothetical protein
LPIADASVSTRRSDQSISSPSLKISNHSIVIENTRQVERAEAVFCSKGT